MYHIERKVVSEMKAIKQYFIERKEETPIWIFVGTMVVMMVLGIGYHTYQFLFPSNVYTYDSAYVDKNQNMIELQHNDKQRKYRIKQYINVKHKNGTNEWEYDKVFGYSKHRPKLSYVYELSDNQFYRFSGGHRPWF